MTSKTKKSEMTVIAGCFYGLAHLLTSFTHSVHEGSYHNNLSINLILFILQPCGWIKSHTDFIYTTAQNVNISSRLQMFIENTARHIIKTCGN